MKRDIKDGKKRVSFLRIALVAFIGTRFRAFVSSVDRGENDKRLKRVLESIYASVVKGANLVGEFCCR